MKPFQTQIILTYTCALTALVGAAAHADEPALAVDGVAAPAAVAHASQAPQLLRPEMAAQQLTLPATVMPEKDRRLLHLRTADLNHNGIIDGEDIILLMERFGECVEGEFCPDLNGDGVIDAADVARMVELLGEGASSSGGSSRVRIGYVEEAPAAVRAPLARQPLDNRRVISRVELSSPGAGGLRIEFESMRASNAEIRVYDPDGETVLGPYRADRADAEGRWWTPTIFGTRIGIEIVHNEFDPGETPPTIARIAYVFAGGDCAECKTSPGNPLACHNCIACFPSWQNADGRAVGQISWISGGGCFICTGALLNRGPGDLSPLFMTANHCIDSHSEANTLEVRWLYDSTSCDTCGGVPDFNDVPRNNGARLLKRRSSADWTLLGLFDPPNITGGAFYLGWSATNWPSGQSATGIHHPRGAHKRLSIGFSAGSTNNQTFCDENGNNCIDADVWDVDYFSGTTEPGSSGSPVFDADRRVRGTLTGGASGCPVIVKRYGRLDLAYANLRYYMGSESIASPSVHVLQWIGDPGNNGNFEQGTSSNPFNAVHEATYAVIAGEELRVAPGNYNETMTIWRPMTITRDGSSGSAVIGAP